MFKHFLMGRRYGRRGSGSDFFGGYGGSDFDGSDRWGGYGRYGNSYSPVGLFGVVILAVPLAVWAILHHSRKNERRWVGDYNVLAQQRRDNSHRRRRRRSSD